MRVLIAYGSKMGGTKGIAETLAEAMRAGGDEVDVAPAGQVRSTDGYRAVIVGGALYANRWHKDARRLIKRSSKSLQSLPVWLFSSGPLDESATERDIPPTGQVQKLMNQVSARGHVTFGGRLPADAKGFPASAMAKEHAGDWRDEDHIRRWAAEISQELHAKVL